MHENGCRIIAVSDVRGGIYNPRGLDVPRLVEHKMAGNSVTEFREGDSIGNVELLELECDVLIPAAIDNVITGKNAPM